MCTQRVYCTWCGLEFEIPDDVSDDDDIFCSDMCETAHVNHEEEQADKFADYDE